MFGKRTRGVLPTMAYTGRVRPKRKPYLGFMYIKSEDLLAEVYEKVGKSIISVCKKARRPNRCILWLSK